MKILILIAAFSASLYAQTLPEMLPGEWSPASKIVNGETIESSEKHEILANEWRIHKGDTVRTFRFKITSVNEEDRVLYLEADPPTPIRIDGELWKTAHMSIMVVENGKKLLRFPITGLMRNPKGLGPEYVIVKKGENALESAKLKPVGEAFAEKKRQNLRPDTARSYAWSLFQYIETQSALEDPKVGRFERDLFSNAVDKYKAELTSKAKKFPITNDDVRPFLKELYDRKLADLKSYSDGKSASVRITKLYEVVNRDPLSYAK